MFDTQNLRMAAQATMLFPLHPLADNADMDESDRRQVIGVYPYTISGITVGTAVGTRGRHPVFRGEPPLLFGQFVPEIDKKISEL